MCDADEEKLSFLYFSRETGQTWNSDSAPGVNEDGAAMWLPNNVLVELLMTDDQVIIWGSAVNFVSCPAAPDVLHAQQPLRYHDTKSETLPANRNHGIHCNLS